MVMALLVVIGARVSVAGGAEGIMTAFAGGAEPSRRAADCVDVARSRDQSDKINAETAKLQADLWSLIRTEAIDAEREVQDA